MTPYFYFTLLQMTFLAYKEREKPTQKIVVACAWLELNSCGKFRGRFSWYIFFHYLLYIIDLINFPLRFLHMRSDRKPTQKFVAVCVCWVTLFPVLRLVCVKIFPYLLLIIDLFDCTLRFLHIRSDKINTGTYSKVCLLSNFMPSVTFSSVVLKFPLIYYLFLT